MSSVGEKLRQARLDKELSWEQVYQATRIHPRVLEALEQDRAQNFLSLPYIKGFLRSYARYLGLDSEKILQEYLQSQKIEAVPVKIIGEKQRPVTARLKLFTVVRAGLIIALSIFLIFYFRFMLKRISSGGGEIRRAKVEVEPAPAPVAQTEDLLLEVRTKEACWMRLTADGEVLFEQTLPKGRRERWRGREKIELRIGKPEAIEVFLNGRQIDLKKAKVKRRLIVTREGITGK